MKNLSKIIALAESLCLGLIVAGAAMEALEYNGTLLLTLGLTGLAIVFFVGAYLPPEVAPEEDDEFGFKELLAWSIVPRVLGISMSVATVGVMFSLQNLPGYPVMVMVGSATIAIALLITMILKAIGVRYTQNLTLKAMRAAIILVVVIALILSGEMMMGTDANLTP